MSKHSPLAKGILITLVAIFLFDIMGAIIKHLGERYPPQQLSMFRNTFALIPSVIALYYSQRWHDAGRPLLIKQWKLGLIRSGFTVMAQFSFYLSITKMELATATTLAFAGPLFVTALSVPLLSNTVGIIRWMAVLIGFAGIVLVMQPASDDFSVYALLPILAAFGYAFNSVSSKMFYESVPTPVINLYSLVGAIIGSTILVIATDAYVAVTSWQDWFWLIAMGSCGGAAVFCLITAYRLTEPSNLSPFEYFGIPFSFILGWVFFSEAPFDKLIPGVFLIVGGGLLIVWRERRKRVLKQPV